MARIFEIKASLVGVKNEIYRIFRVDSSINLQVLHEIFQTLFTWENFHLHFFQDSKGQEIQKEDQVTLAQVLSNDQNLTYVYDYGDSWTLDILLINSFEDTIPGVYPLCIGGLRKSPPEDSGGITGYEMSLDLMKGEKRKNFSFISEWYGEGYDPEYFNLEEMNRTLSRYRG